MAERAQLSSSSRRAQTSGRGSLISGLVAIFFLATACGTDLDSLTDEDNSTLSQTETTESTAAPSLPTSGTQTKVEVVVEVTVSEVEGTTGDVDLPYFYFDPRPMSWASAVSSAPDGYALVSRSDVLDLLESGELWDYVPQDSVFWTISQANDGMIWAFEMNTQYFWKMIEVSKFPALYYRVTDASAQEPISTAGTL